MSLYSQPVFLVEQLQPYWLSTHTQRWGYAFIVSLFSHLILGLAVGLFLKIFLLPFQLGLYVSLGLGLVRGFLHKPRASIPMTEVTPPSLWSWPGARQGLWVGALIGLLFTGVKLWHGIDLLVLTLFTAPCCGSVWVPMGGIVGAVIGGLNTLPVDVIQPIESLKWSWKNTLKGMFRGFLGGCSVSPVFIIFVSSFFCLSCVIASVIVGATNEGNRTVLILLWLLILFLGFIFILATASILGIVGIVLGGIRRGLSNFDLPDKIVPNQGIRHSIKNAIFIGLLSGLILWLATGLIFGVTPYVFLRGTSRVIVRQVPKLRPLMERYGPQLLEDIDDMEEIDPELYPYVFDAVQAALAGEVSDVLDEVSENFGRFVTGRWLNYLPQSLLFGLCLALFFGGHAALQHYILRVFLWRTGAMPWQYPRFLNYATTHLFLHKVGAGYMFTHRLLQDYFANLAQAIPLSDDRWHYITEGHDDIAKYHDAVLDTLNAPTWILKGYANTDIAAREQKDGRYLMVVYQQSHRGDKHVITAYVSRTLNQEKVIWKKQ